MGITLPSERTYRLARLGVGLWLIYAIVTLLLLFALAPRSQFPPWYNTITIAVPAILLVLLMLPGVGRVPEAILVPVVIAGMTLVPLLINLSPLPPGPPNPVTSAEGRTLRMLPILFLALSLVAWRYDWEAVIGFSAGTSLITIGVIIAQVRSTGFAIGEPAMIASTIALFVQTVSFLFVGFFISALAAELRKQKATVEDAHRQLSHYAGTVEQLTVSRERNRMARELHDTVAHTLSGLSVQLETTKALLDVDGDAARHMLNSSLTTARDGLNETRRALVALRAAPLDDLGLCQAIRQLAASAASRTGVSVDVILPSTPVALPPDVEHCIYRVAQEGIANVVAHSAAGHLSVTLAVKGTHADLTISDNGRGFDQHAVRSGSFGIQGMQERAALVGATLTLDTVPGGGTHLRLKVG